MLAALTGPALVAACGSRTGLFVPPPKRDAAVSDQSAPDVVEEPDATEEPDVIEEEDSSDVEDVAEIGFPDGPDICPDAGSTLIYTITETNDLFSFYPPTLGFTLIGHLSCPAPAGTTPFSMAVDRQGLGRSVFTDGALYLIDMGTAACAATTFQPDQIGFQTFCMGYTANGGDGGDAGETLYVADCPETRPQGTPSTGLATLDTSALTLRYVGPFSSPNPGPELTGTSDGRLFGFYTNTTGSGSHIIQIDPATATVLHDYPLQVGAPDDGYAFAYWGGVFWVFTSTISMTTVTRFDPVTGSETNVTSLGEGIVGAGVSTCAPM